MRDLFLLGGGLTSDFDKSAIAIREVSFKPLQNSFGIPWHFFCHATTPPPELADFLTIASDLRISYRFRKSIAEITSFVYMTFSGTCYVESSRSSSKTLLVDGNQMGSDQGEVLPRWFSNS